MTSNQKSEKIIILDANVIISLINVNKLDVLKQLVEQAKYKFIIPLEVKNEIHYKNQRLQISKALKEKWIEKRIIEDDIQELELYAKYTLRFGKGESACMAISMRHKLILASDEKAVKKEISNVLGADYVIGTKDILLVAKRLKIISDSELEQLSKSKLL